MTFLSINARFLRRNPHHTFPPLLPLATDPSARFLPWLMMVVTFLASIALAATLSLGHLSHHWQLDLAHGMTIAIPETYPGSVSSADDRGQEAVLKYLRETAGVISIHPVASEETRQLITPWLGNTMDDLPMPRLIDIQVDPDVPLRADQLQKRLTSINPGITVEAHQTMTDDLTTPARLARIIALAVMISATALCVLVVCYAARAALRAQESLLSLLSIMGADDRVLLREFGTHLVVRTIPGAACGLALAAFGLHQINQAFIHPGSNFAWMTRLDLTTLDWLLIILVPIWLCAMAVSAGWYLVRRYLSGKTR